MYSVGVRDIKGYCILILNKQLTNDLKLNKEVTGKPHNDVLKAIRAMEGAWYKVTKGNFSLSEYTDPTGRKLPMLN